MKSTFLLFLFLANTSLTLSQDVFWQQTNGPQGGFISTICFQDSVIFAGGIGGVFKSTDDADRWFQSGLPKTQVNKIVACEGLLFAGTDRHGIFRSTDLGLSWMPLNGGLPYYVGITDMAVKDTFVFAATRYDGVFRITVRGENWQVVNNGIDNRDIRTIIVSNSSVIASAAGASGSGMFRTTNDGQTWTRVDPYPYAWMADAVCRFNNTLYGSRFSNGAKVYVSGDDGQTWNLPSGALAPSDIIISLFADQTGLYAGIYNRGIYRSNNSGVTWANVSNGLYNQSPVCIAGDCRSVLIGSFDGIRKTTNTGAAWLAKNNGLTNGQVSCISSVGGFIFAGTQGSGLFRSSNLGSTWTQVSPSAVKPFVTGIVTVQSSLYILTEDWTYGGTVLMSSSFGNAWVERKNGIDTGDLLSIASAQGVLYVSSSNGVFKSINGGLTWTRLVNGPNVASVAATSSVVIAAKGESRIYRSVDAGENWTTVSVPPGITPPIVKVAVVDTMMFAGCSQVNVLFQSSDMGATWQRIQTPLFNGSVEDITGSQGVVFVAVSGGGVISNNGGSTWDLLNAGLFNTDIRSIHFAEGRVWAGSWGAGVFRSVDSSEIAPQPIVDSPTNGAINQHTTTALSWHRSATAESYHLQLSTDAAFTSLLIDDSTIVDTFRLVGPLEYIKTYYWRVAAANMFGRSVFSEVSSLTTAPPSDFSLEQNYPNPFNSETTIRFNVPFASTVRLVVYNLLGQRVATIVDERFPPGTHSRAWNAVGVPSGVYFYRLESGSHTQTIKALLLK